MSSTSTLDNLKTVVIGLSGFASEFMIVVQAFAYAASIFFVIMSIIMMTRAANPTARNSQAVGGTGWFWSLVIGVVMFALPSTMSVFGELLFPNSTPTASKYFSYLQGDTAAANPCSSGSAGLFPLLLLFGYIAFVRGLIVLRSVGMYGNHSRANASFARGVILLVAGIALVHMRDLLEGINLITGLSLGAGLC